MTKEKFVCHVCGSDNVNVEARVSWNIETQCWDLEEITWSECLDCYNDGDGDSHYGQYEVIENE